MDVPREGQRNAERRRRVPGAGPVREQDLERLGRRRGKRGPHVLRLWVVQFPIARVVNAQERQHRAVPLYHVRAVLHEHLPRFPHAAHDLVLSGVAIVVAQHRHDAERRRKIAERAHVVRDVGRIDVDHVASLDDQVGLERVRLGDQRLHLVPLHVDAGVHVGEVQQPQPLEAGRQVTEHQRAAGDLGQPEGAPDPVARERRPGTGVSVGRSREELASRYHGVGSGEWYLAVRAGGAVRAATYHSPLPTQFGHHPPPSLAQDVARHERAEDPGEQLPREPRCQVGNAPQAPHAAGQQARCDEQPRRVEEREHEGEAGAHAARLARPRRVGKPVAQIQIQEDLRRQEQEQID